MALLRILSQINHITENIYHNDVGNNEKDVHDLRGYILYILAAQKPYKEEQEHNSEEYSNLLSYKWL